MRQEFNLTQRRIANFKYFVYICLALAIAIDLAVFVVLTVYALPVKYWILPLVLTVADILFLVISIFVNFRFKYCLPYIIVYGGAVVVFAVLSLVFGLDTGSGTAYTTIALLLWPILHIAIAAAVVIAALFSAQNGKKFKLAGAVICALLLLVTAGYGIYFSGAGYFGQGASQMHRVLLYSLDEKTDTYTVVGAETGNSDSVLIPKEFNGKKVGAVDCGLFSVIGVTKVQIDCGPDVKFVNEDKIESINDNLTILAPKDDFDELRDKMYASGKLDFAKHMEPAALNEDEVFVTFVYDHDLGEIGSYAPTWYGKKGDAFTFIANAPEWYNRSDLGKAEDLIYAYENRNKLIFGGFYADSSLASKLNGKPVQESMKNVYTHFERVYSVGIGDDNDGSYESPDSYRYTMANNKKYATRYIVAADGDSLIAALPARDGFDVEWVYQEGAAEMPLGSLTAKLTGEFSSKDGITVCPRWTLKAPDLKDIEVNTSPTYGDEVTFKGSATAPRTDIELAYVWTRDGNEIGITSAAFTNECIGIDEGGTYKVTVTAYSADNAITTLTSQASVTVKVTVNKRQLTFNWTVPENDVYTGLDKPVSTAYRTQDVVKSDEITFSPSVTSVKNAGAYALGVTLSGDCAKKYIAVNDINTFTIKRAPLTITIGDYEKTYDGTIAEASVCSYVSEGLVNDETLSAPVYASDLLTKKDAGVYRIEVSFPDSADMLKNYETTYNAGTANVKKCPVEFDWQSAAAFIYSGEQQFRALNAMTLKWGFTVLDGELQLESAKNNVIYSVGGRALSSDLSLSRDAGDYTVTAKLVHNNFTLGTDPETAEELTESRDYTIAKKDITLVWGEDTFVYDGNTHRRVVDSADGIVARDENNYLGWFTYDVTGKNADSYSIIATFASGNYNVLNPNSTFVISPAPIRVTWSVSGEAVYDGAAHNVRISGVPGAVAADVSALIAGFTYDAETSITNVGTLNVTATLNDANYVMEDAELLKNSFKITKRPVSYTWAAGSYTYNSTAQGPTIPDGNITNVVSGEIGLFARSYGGYGTNAGNYTATMTFDEPSALTNYNITGTPTQQYTIAQKRLVYTWASTKSFTYDGTAHQLRGTLSGVVEGDALELEFPRVESAIDVGTYTETAAIPTASPLYINYCLTASGEKSVTSDFTVTARKIVINSWSLGTESYWTYDGDHVVKITEVTNLVSPTTPDDVFGYNIYFGNGTTPTAGNVFHDVGDHTIEATLTDGNYTVLNTDLLRRQVHITQKDLYLNWGSLTTTYNRTNQKPSVSLSDGTAVVAGDTVNISLCKADKTTLANDMMNAGTYQVVAVPSDANYSLVGAAKDYVISPKEITVNWAELSKVYNKAEQRPTVTVSGGGLSPDVIELAVTGATNAGEHTVTATSKNSNYVVSSSCNTNTLTIEKREINLTWKEYNASTASYNSSTNTFTWTYDGNNHYAYVSKAAVTSGTATGDETNIRNSITYTPTPRGITGAGEKSENAVLSATYSANYVIAGNPAVNYVVNRRSVTLSWDATPLIYDGKEQKPTASLTGLVAGESFAVTVTVTAGGGINAGDHTATASVPTLSGNYELTGALTKEYSIEKAELTVAWPAVTDFVENGQPQAPAPTNLDGISCELRYYNESDVELGSAPTAAGTYKVMVTLTGDDAGNYKIKSSTESCLFTITAESGE